jgi:hypothetical protein
MCSLMMRQTDASDAKLASLNDTSARHAKLECLDVPSDAKLDTH